MAKAKAAKKNRKPAVRVPQIVTFKKEAKEDALPKQAAVILSIVKSNKSLTVHELQAKMHGKVETTQELPAIWSFYRKALIDGGYIRVEKAKPAAKAPKAAKTAAVAA